MANRAKTLNADVFTIADLRDKASKKLPKAYREFYNEGAMDMISVQDNEAAYNRYKIRPRILRNVADLDTSTDLFGHRISFPFAFSPAATHKLAHPDGELATSAAAAACNIPMALSAYASCALEDVIRQRGEQGTNPYIMQFSILKDRALTQQILQRAESAGYQAVMMTVDAPLLGRRLNEFRNAFALPAGVGYPNLRLAAMADLVDQGAGLAYEDAWEWDQAIPWIRSVTRLPIWLKGVYTAEDVALAIRHGVDGILISNHGGRQLDGVPATLDALRECAPIAKGKIKIAVDGGIRRGTDIFKALALGADYCFAGRIPIWGLAYNGSKGVELAVQLLHEEFKLAMALAGCRTVKDINKSHLSILQNDGVLSKL
ncbi:hypothetical protein ASPZODRAFT_66565 [Penicilliopsis zonata CBS 506.65]|uniref:Oxidase FUB9 n=1 Tax=Penicilliopsis zonata CBS 506.65 TaxID=1073090 RepID=A0A1L9SHV9_9EURO|nr:hypothetical protein ASPZODRAFT_66565 [Penicilliopsis zonata CBS 506.65]OJJ46810.1 hypothetical protein ASPZODRAFT_66565 [Penicilliopsis zonata CBS 506.65]